jgi:reverse gyrase
MIGLLQMAQQIKGCEFKARNFNTHIHSSFAFLIYQQPFACRILKDSSVKMSSPTFLVGTLVGAVMGAYCAQNYDVS